MFCWVIFHYLFLSRFPEIQLHELKSTWLRALLATIVGFGTGLALLRRPNAVNFLWLGILISFAYLFYQYIPLGPKPTTNIVIKGARQSPKYFPVKVEPDWESALGPSVRKRIEVLAGLDPSVRNNTYAIHIRLGDYRLLPHHQVDLANYYKKALDKVPEGARLHVFSDEPNTCIRLFKTIAEERKLILSMAVTQSDVESLYEMTLCLGGTITANSTFSWWGAWFAHQAGAKWATFPSSMGAGMPEPTDFYPEWATVLEV
jgi:TusA-related sulfurtransferase